jgi:hypothetical protein
MGKAAIAKISPNRRLSSTIQEAFGLQALQTIDLAWSHLQR